MLKITFLTQTVLDDFVRKFDVGSLTDEQAREVEHLAYCACMSAVSGDDYVSFARKLFIELLDRFLGIRLEIKEVYA